MAVFGAVAFGEHNDVVVAFEALLEDFAEACVHARVLVDRNVAGAVQNPAEHGSLPETCLSHERSSRDGVPDDVDVQKALVVCDDDVVDALRDVFGALDGDLDAEKLENDFLEGE